MTHEHSGEPKEAGELRPSTLPFNPADLLAMRVLPAEFARMVGVSKQTVSHWINEKGILSLGPDGRLDPVKAVRRLIESANPSRLRARLLKQACSDFDALRERNRELEAALTVERDKLLKESRERARFESAVRFQEQEAAAKGLDRVSAVLEQRFDEAIAAWNLGGLATWFDELLAVEFYGQDLLEYRRIFADEPQGPNFEDESGDAPVHHLDP